MKAKKEKKIKAWAVVDKITANCYKEPLSMTFSVFPNKKLAQIKRGKRGRLVALTKIVPCTITYTPPSTFT